MPPTARQLLRCSFAPRAQAGAAFAPRSRRAVDDGARWSLLRRALPHAARAVLSGWVVAAALHAAPARAATCEARAAGVAVALELAGADAEAWAPWCAKLTDLLQLRPPLTAAAAAAAEARLAGLEDFRAVVCEATTERLLCRLEPALMVTDEKVTGKLPLTMLREDVRRRVFLRSGTRVARPAEMVAQQEERLVKYLVGEGYLDARAHVTLRPHEMVLPYRGARVEAEVTLGPAFHVADVAVVGSPVISDREVARAFRPAVLLGLGRGRFRPPALIEEARALEERLQAAGYVSARVRAHANRREGTAWVDLHVEIVAGPWLSLTFTGELPVSRRRLAAATTFRGAGAIDGLEIEASRRAVVRALQEAGYDEARVEVTSERSHAAVRVTFAVVAGRRRWLDAVDLSLPDAARARVDEGALFARLATRPSFLAAETWVEERALGDCRALTQALREAGFRGAEVAVEKRSLPGLDDRVEARFSARVGAHDAVEDVVLVGLPAGVHQAPLVAQLSCRDGGPWVDGAIEQDVGRLEAGLVAQGYLAAKVTAHHETRPTPAGSRTSVTFHVEPGIQARLSSLLVRGRVRTKLDVVEDEVRLAPGDVLAAAPITRTRRRLTSFNIFSGLEFTPLSASADNPNTQLMVAVQERDDTTLDGIVGFSTDDDFAVGASYNDRNLLGRAINLTADARFANALEVGWLSVPHGRDPATGEPGRLPLRIGNVDRLDLKVNTFSPFGAPFDVELGAGAEYRDYRSFRFQRIGGSVALARPLLDRDACRFCPQVNGRLAYELSSATLDVKSLEAPGPKPTATQADAATIGRVAPSFTADRRDSALDPHVGYFGSLRLEAARPPLAGPLFDDAADFWRVLTRAQGFVPVIGGPGGADSAPTSLLGGPLVLALGGEWDVAGFFGETGRLPPSESFAYGGDYSVRGLALRGAQALLGEEVRGRFMLTLSAELRWYLYRIGIGTVQLAGFVDYGAVGADLASLFDGQTVTAGPALRYVTQVGPLTLAYGRILTAPAALRAAPSAAPPGGRLHFMFGYSF